MMMGWSPGTISVVASGELGTSFKRGGMRFALVQAYS